MERESFEDAAIAKLMNELFVCIKVDREERPDLDAIYMAAVQSLTGHGGWPMSVFLTPEGEPSHGGTYYPPDDRHGMPSFRRILHRESRRATSPVAATWPKPPTPCATSMPPPSPPRAPPGSSPPHCSRVRFRALAPRYDAHHGGFEGAPKFPQPMSPSTFPAPLGPYRPRPGARHRPPLLSRRPACGGIYDQIGGGFARYATDAIWLVPHFEKMLYDNALLSRLGVHLWQATHDHELRRTCEQTFTWLAREMTAPSGGFYSTLDADSEGEEGKFYLWNIGEIQSLLGDDAGIVNAYFGVEPGGNFEGHTILHRSHDTGTVAHTPRRSRRSACTKRSRAPYQFSTTPAPNASGPRAMKRFSPAGTASCSAPSPRATAPPGLTAPEYRALARWPMANSSFREMVRDHRVYRSHKDGVTRITGYLEDYAAIALGALALYELTFDRVWLNRARDLAHAIVRWFWDEQAGAFFDTPTDHEPLITRPRGVTDNATPAGASLAVELSLRMAELFGDAHHRQRAERVLASLAEPMAQHPLAFGHLLGAAGPGGTWSDPVGAGRIAA